MAFDAFLKVDGIPGESSDAKHKEWIDLIGFEHSANQPNTGSLGTRGLERVNQGPFKFRHEIDKSSPKLQMAMHTGQNIAKIELEVCKATGDKQLYYKVELENSVIGSVRTSGLSMSEAAAADAAAGGTPPAAAPVEEVEVWCDKITWTYTETDHKTGASKGNIEAHWSYEDNEGG